MFYFFLFFCYLLSQQLAVHPEVNSLWQVLAARIEVEKLKRPYLNWIEFYSIAEFQVIGDSLIFTENVV